VLKVANSVGRDELHSMGTNMGKFTRTKKFRLHVTALDILAQYAKYKVWIKPTAEMAFLYGNHIIKAGLGRITENTPKCVFCFRFSLNSILPFPSSTLKKFKIQVRSPFSLESHP
jgi:60S ribosome subunit biogenesis protein NIP7